MAYSINILLYICTKFKVNDFIMIFMENRIATILMDTKQCQQQSLKQFQGFQLLVV